jgi:tetratricopeptide (TPR) repeat protein
MGEDKNEIDAHLNAVRAADTDDPEELFRVCVTFCELELFPEAIKYLKRILEYRPYDKRLLHALAACYYHTGEVREALAQWDKALKISPEDPVIEYCRAAAMRAIKGEKPDMALSCRYQVPYAEMLRRLSRINQIITQQSEESIKVQWREDHEFRTLVLWGLELGEDGVQRALTHLLGLIGDEDAKESLRRLLLNRNIGDDIKQDIFGLLKKLDAPEPYTAYLGGRIIEARVNVMSVDDMEMPEKLREVLLAFAEKSSGHIDAPVVRHAMELWRQFAQRCGDAGPDIRSSYAWAAALEYIAREDHHVRTLKGELCVRYETTLPSLNRCCRKIREVLEVNP